MDEYTRNKMPAEAGRRIEERRQEFNAAWDKEEARQKLLAEEKRTLECVNAMLGIADPAATMKEVREVLEKITECEHARRHGGPAPEDLEALDAALSDAVHLAAALLSKLGGE